jgi:hypothetical protein
MANALGEQPLMKTPLMNPSCLNFIIIIIILSKNTARKDLRECSHSQIYSNTINLCKCYRSVSLTDNKKYSITLMLIQNYFDKN